MARTDVDAMTARYRRASEEKDSEEIRRYATMSVAEKWAELDALCRDGQRLTRVLGRSRQVAEYRDPLPARSIAILAELRRKARERGSE